MSLEEHGAGRALARRPDIACIGTAMTETSVETVVDRALEMARKDLDQSGARVQVVLDEPAPSLSIDDPDLFAQALLELLLNAVEASGEAVRIQLRIEEDDAGVRIEIADDGPGIPPEQAERIGRRFYTTKETGTGLGLHLASRLVQEEGGRLEFVDGAGAGPQGKGACVRILLPMEKGAP